MFHQGKALFLHSHIPKGVGEDGLQWQLRGNGFFDIRSCYLVLRGSQPMNFPWRSIWHVKAPRRVSLFVWSAAWERILTIDNLKRGCQLARWCCMCQCDGETVNHLQFHCFTASVLWSFVFRMFGIQEVLPRRVADLDFGWRNWFGRHNSDIWNLVPLCLMWSLWCKQNSRIVQEVERSKRQLHEYFFSKLYEWSRAWGFTSSNYVTSFLTSLCPSLNSSL